MARLSHPPEEEPPSFAQIFKRATLGHRARAMQIAEALDDPEARAVRHVLDQVGRLHRARLYYATRPTTNAGRARLRWERDVRALVTALETVLGHFELPWTPKVLEDALALARRLGGPGVPRVLVDPDTGEARDWGILPPPVGTRHRGNRAAPYYHWAFEQLTRRLGLVDDDARVLLRAAGLPIRLSRL